MQGSCSKIRFVSCLAEHQVQQDTFAPVYGFGYTLYNTAGVEGGGGRLIISTTGSLIRKPTLPQLVG